MEDLLVFYQSMALMANYWLSGRSTGIEELYI